MELDQVGRWDLGPIDRAGDPESIDLEVELELAVRVVEPEIAPVVGRGLERAITDLAPCLLRGRLAAAPTASVTKISAVVPAAAVVAAPISVPAAAAAVVALAAVVAAVLLTQVAAEADVVWEVVG